MKGFRPRIQALAEEVINAAEGGCTLVILSDAPADYDHPAIPGLIGLRAVVKRLNDLGLRLNTSLVMHTAEARTPHDVAALLSFGASAVCPYLALQIARTDDHELLRHLNAEQREENLIHALEAGLLKIMSKSGISVVQSYISAKRFTAIGLGSALMENFFPGNASPLGGIGYDELAEDILWKTDLAMRPEYARKLLHTYQLREHSRGAAGEKHSLTSARARVVHKIVRADNTAAETEALYNEYLQHGDEAEPISVRHLFELKKSPIPLAEVEPLENILRHFGSGAMSFGAVSAEAQRDIFLAMKEVGGRSNSGEGGENPYYFSDGITATTKQVASARFGVTAEYLLSGRELQIKIAQGAKPGEGGQLMSAKVNVDIARARHSLPNVDLISPPPLHDIYSIEDLKELIYELKQVHPTAEVSVKLVSGSNIGTIAVGVAKAGADIIYVAGGDGGTGAATIGSMKHAGLPWEFGLVDVHNALVENNLRRNVQLRTDGGLLTGKDVIVSAILGAEGYDFGKLLLVAEGCIMARICEKNTCPTGIATHDPKFKAKYRGTKDQVVKMLKTIAEDVRRHLASVGARSIAEIVGRSDLLMIAGKHRAFIEQRKLDLSLFLSSRPMHDGEQFKRVPEGVGTLNQQIVEDARQTLRANGTTELAYEIASTDRAVPATLCGEIARRIIEDRHKSDFQFGVAPFRGSVQLNFTGSAGQGFGVFLTDGIEMKLFGEANDSVCKSMSGGKVTIRPHPRSILKPEENVIIGNCALYGATGGTLFVHGLAGDRFAVRNSGATAVVEGVGLHACEYMTRGTVVVLGKVSHNVGAGMTGGTLYMARQYDSFVNKNYLVESPISDEDREALKSILEQYAIETESTVARWLLQEWLVVGSYMGKYSPLAIAARIKKVDASNPVPDDQLTVDIEKDRAVSL